MRYLKQSTAKVISFGPAVANTDGVTLVTSLVSAIDHASTGIMLSKNGGAFAVRHATVTASTYDAYGNYLVTLDTTDTNTLGPLVVQYAAASTNLVIRQDYTVLSAAVFDWFIGTTDFTIGTTATTAIQTAIRTDPATGYKGTGTAAGGSANTIILASGAGAALAVKAGDIIVCNADGVYDVQTVASISTDTCTMDGNWSTNVPDSNDTYYIYGGGTGLTTTALAAAYLTVDVRKVNNVTLQGAGTSGDKWRPA